MVELVLVDLVEDDITSSASYKKKGGEHRKKEEEEEERSKLMNKFVIYVHIAIYLLL